MRDIFLGKPIHWLFLCIAIALLWWAGLSKLHVIYFNGFLISLTLGSLALVLLIIKTTKPGERVTRDELQGDDNPQDSTEPQ